MSQRMHAASAKPAGASTPAPAKKPRTRRAPAAPAETAPTPAAEPVSGEELARVLRAVAGELERDPALARRVAEAMGGESPAESVAAAPSAPAAAEHPTASRAAPAADTPAADTPAADTPAADTPAAVGRSFLPRLVTGLAPDLGPGVPDPFALRARLGEAGLRAALADLRLGTLRAMVREHALDPTGRLKGVNDAAKLRAAILAATRART